jgi:hypothetical protein
LEQDRHGEAERLFLQLSAAASPSEAPTSSSPTVQRMPSPQLSLFGEQTHPVLKQLRSLDIEQLTPLEALNLLHDMQQTLLHGE